MKTFHALELLVKKILYLCQCLKYDDYLVRSLLNSATVEMNISISTMSIVFYECNNAIDYKLKKKKDEYSSRKRKVFAVQFRNK